MKANTRRIMAFSSLAAFFLVIAAQFYIIIAGITVDESSTRMLDASTVVLFTIVLTMKDFYFGSSEGSGGDSV